MIKRIFPALAAGLLLLQPSGAFARQDHPRIFSEIESFRTSRTALPEVPGAGAPSSVAVKGDFTAIPGYSFAYLNALTVKLIEASRSEIDIAMFSVTLKDMPEAVLRAKARGVRVRMIIDESHIYPRMDRQIRALVDAGGIEIRSLRGTRSYGVNHNKIGIFDRSLVTTGSYNWTAGATYNNFENMLASRQPAYVNGYAAYFDWMWSKSRTLAQGPSPEVPGGYYGVPPQDPSPSIVFNGLTVPAYLFSPGSDTETRLARIIAAAGQTLDIVTFTFSSKILADAVIDAKKRGVRVRFLMDGKMAAVSPMARYLFDNGVEFHVRGGRSDKGCMHNKFAIFDGVLLETGSFNWTYNASVNSFENMLFTSERAALREYQTQYDWFYSSSSAVTADFFQPEGRQVP